MSSLQRTTIFFVLLFNLSLLQAEPLGGLQFIEIPAGEFVMGTTNLDEAVADMPKPDKNMITDETPAHRVIFKQSFCYPKQK